MSEFDCAKRCNEVEDCAIFQYNVHDRKDCLLFSQKTKLSDSCLLQNKFNTYVMYRRGQFTLNENGCILSEVDITKKITFNEKTVAECAALCDKWFSCRSFRASNQKGSCVLYETEEKTNSSCPDLKTTYGELYTYFSDFYYVELNEFFCVSASAEISFIHNVPLEACKAICDKHELCVAFEYNRNGDCLLLSSSDFSVNCQPDIGRTLYISYKNVMEERSEFVYHNVSGCFETIHLFNISNVSDVSSCQFACSKRGEKCLGYEFDARIDFCYLVLESSLLKQVDCSSSQSASLQTT